MKVSFEKEFNLEQIGEENLGFSIIHEFLAEYKKFVSSLTEQILLRYDEENETWVKRDERDYVEILPNFFTLKIYHYHEIDEVLDKYVKIYEKYFRRWMKSQTPITLSISTSDIKFPFFEHWQYLNSEKEKPINVRISRKVDLEIDFHHYEQLKKLTQYPETKLSHFLHLLDTIERKTESGLLVETLVAERQKEFQKIFDEVPKAKHILAYYKLMRGKILEKNGHTYIF